MPATKHKGKGHPVYKAAFAKQAEVMCRLGATDAELAEALGVSTFTIKDWRTRHSAFGEACKLGKDAADDRVEMALYNRAVGYTFDSEKVFCSEGQVVRAPTKEHVPPDFSSMRMWLMNRRPEAWRAIQDATVAEGEEGAAHRSPEDIAKDVMRKLAKAADGARDGGAKLHS